MKRLDIDFSHYSAQLDIRKAGDRRLVFDPVRKTQLVLTPEEFVRQLLLLYFIHDCRYNPNRISIERQLLVNGLQRRYDLLVFDPSMNPFLLVECKAPAVELSQAACDQIARYNLSLQVPFLLLTNGRHTICCEMDYANNRYEYLDRLPEYPRSVQNGKIPPGNHRKVPPNP